MRQKKNRKTTFKPWIPFVTTAPKVYIKEAEMKKIEHNRMDITDNVNTRNKLQSNIDKAVEEALGNWTVNKNDRNKSAPWLTNKIKELTVKKPEEYLRYFSNRTRQERHNYKELRNRKNMCMREIKTEYWMSFIKDIENDLYGAPTKIRGALRQKQGIFQNKHHRWEHMNTIPPKPIWRTRKREHENRQHAVEDTESH